MLISRRLQDTGRSFPWRLATGDMSSPGDLGMSSPAAAVRKRHHVAVKFGLDALVAIVILLVVAPVMCLAAILVKLDGGPVFFSQARIGRGGKMFQCLKFRSMSVRSSELLNDLLLRDPEAAKEWAETRKLRHDPRVTWVGAFLRKASIDELPQLFNVLRGEMSLVGPRPIVEQEVSRYAENIAYYHAVRPGLTGLWQVSGRSSVSYDSRVQLDVSYVQNWSLTRDLMILLKTIPAVLQGSGAV
jgi:Undecaprenyl-phosphate galactose phosphotransferase WbaP